MPYSTSFNPFKPNVVELLVLLLLLDKHVNGRIGQVEDAACPCYYISLKSTKSIRGTQIMFLLSHTPCPLILCLAQLLAWPPVPAVRQEQHVQ